MHALSQSALQLELKYTILCSIMNFSAWNKTLCTNELLEVAKKLYE